MTDKIDSGDRAFLARTDIGRKALALIDRLTAERDALLSGNADQVTTIVCLVRDRDAALARAEQAEAMQAALRTIAAGIITRNHTGAEVVEDHPEAMEIAARALNFPKPPVDPLYEAVRDALPASMPDHHALAITKKLAARGLELTQKGKWDGRMEGMGHCALPGFHPLLNKSGLSVMTDNQPGDQPVALLHHPRCAYPCGRGGCDMDCGRDYPQPTTTYATCTEIGQQLGSDRPAAHRAVLNGSGRQQCERCATWVDDNHRETTAPALAWNAPPAPVVDGLATGAISAQVDSAPVTLSPLADATYAIADLVAGEDWSLDAAKASAIIREYGEACVAAALRNQSDGAAERERMRKALQWIIAEGGSAESLVARAALEHHLIRL